MPASARQLIALLFLAGLGLAAPAAAAEPASQDLGTMLPAWSTLPFLGILLSIALFPLLAPRFWHHHYPKVALAWGIAVTIPFVGVYGGRAVHVMLDVALLDYVPFIILLATLFTIGGGIY
ncbi:MAG TPA: sodium:proton antiporter, partial [Thermoanaerobaculia bacterium]|nr:sodium:proton antiporter [Thermoanaerobaculia bacterium]